MRRMGRSNGERGGALEDAGGGGSRGVLQTKATKEPSTEVESRLVRCRR